MAIHRGAITYDNGVFRERRDGDIIPRGKKCGPRVGGSRVEKSRKKAKKLKWHRFDPDKMRVYIGHDWVERNLRNSVRDVRVF